MDRVITVAQVIVPIFVSILLGMLARKKQLLNAEEVRGLQNFVVKFGLPCVVFNSCVTAEIGGESLTTMALGLAMILLGSMWAFWYGRKIFPYHNFPMLFAAQETGMLGIPLFIILFGADQAYRMGVLDVAQAAVAFPMIAILSAQAGENPSLKEIVKKVVTSPLLIMAAIGLTLNLSGMAKMMAATGILGILMESTGFLTQPVSALMIFSVGYNFSLKKESRGPVLKIASLRFAICFGFGLLIQLVLALIPGVDSLTRLTMLMYCTLPTSYLSPGLGRSQEDYTVASGVCSVLTAVSLLIFCGIAAVTA
ncbi:MAG: AEC family transporter [Oscillospiraceae bacterium]|nr:AEC family transporter [Oscillospiraceae bacterium]